MVDDDVCYVDVGVGANAGGPVEGAHPLDNDEAEQERSHPRHGVHHDGRPLQRHRAG